MINDNTELIRKLINETISLKNEIRKLNNRINHRITKQLIKEDKLNSMIFYNTNSYLNPDFKAEQDFNIKEGKIVINFD